MDKQWIINSAHSLQAFNKVAEGLFREHKYITFSAPRIGKDRSLNQNALFHVWCSEYVAYRLDITRKNVTEGMLQGMKEIVKNRFTATHPDAKFMAVEIVNPFNGKKKMGYASSKSWKKGEMFIGSRAD